MLSRNAKPGEHVFFSAIFRYVKAAVKSNLHRHT